VLEANGAIFFETEVGQGTTFQVYLPRSDRALDVATPAQDAGALRAGKGETVLVVEDDASVRQVTVRILVQAGFRVLQASNLVQAVKLTRATTETIDLLLTDLVLPDGSGGDVAERIAELRPEVRVLFVSGYTDDPGLRRGISEHELEFLSKPFAPSRLISRVREVLEKPAQRGPKSTRPN
jgi:two-component system, cell cycle sensor histidine kinase and response regulator CckA